MSELSSSELLSHPIKSLRLHLEGVAESSKQTIATKRLDFPDIDNSTLEDITYILGVCHDFGKSTYFFQEYIRETDDGRKLKLKNNPQTKHGLISAIFTYYVLKKKLSEKNEDLWYIAIFGYLMVKRHHGNLKNPVDEILSLIDDETIDVLVEQAKSIDIQKVLDVYDGLLSDIDITEFLDEIKPISNEIRNSRRKLTRFLKEQDSVYYYVLFQLLYSSLINADKSDASGLINPQKHEISSTLIDDYRQIKGWKNSDNKMGNIRNSIYNDVISHVEFLNLHEKIYSLNVPTGTGKTLASFSLALKLREKIKNQLDFEPKIIYSLPFLSVIDQNCSVFEDVFKSVYGSEPTTDILLKHHHLTDVFYSTDDDEFKEDKALFMIEGWNSEIIVTTFIQMFHTMISRRNRSLRKFHNLANSIIILDEVQSIPHEYWLLLKELLSAISRHFNTYFIFVTATQPLIFDEQKGEISELVENKNHYFEQFDRIELNYNPDPMHIEDFKNHVSRDIEDNGGKDFLIVLNTINSTKELYEHLLSQNFMNTEYYYLSTSITPKERLKKIQEIKENKNRKVIVSTQLIEAGVDIDVDIVYRDMATLDSINQVAGRCNRNYREGDKGIVNIVTLTDDRQEFHRYIYSGFLIDKTKEVLEGFKTIPENQFLNLNNQYFKIVKGTQSNDNSKKLLGYLSNLRFENLQKDFQLIQNDYIKLDVFVELDALAQNLWKKYQCIREIKNPLERKNEFLGIKKQFYEYVISVSKDKAQSLMDVETGIGYISREELNSWYDKETGFIPGSGGVLIF
jgi:CRISPR-associated endonuclease/helicase Cas3